MYNSRRIGRFAVAFLSVPAIVSALGGKALAQEKAPSESAPEQDQCAAVHLVLVNGTFDTSAQKKSTEDHGFGSQLAGKAMRKANETQPDDPSAGIALEDSEDTEQATAATEDDASQSTNDLWGDSGSTTARPTEDLWGAEPSAPAKSASQGDLWGDASTATSSENSEWEVEQGEDVTKDGVHLARTYITYPAAAGGAFVPGLPAADSVPYKDSMYQGAVNTAKVLKEISADCPNTKVFLAGHSQGAQVVSTVAREIGNGASDFPAEKIAGVALFSDPIRDEGVPVMQSNGDTPAAVPGTSGENIEQVGPFSSPEQNKLDGAGMGVNHSGKDFGVLADRTASWCADGDLVCDLPISGELSKLVIGTAERLDLDDPEASLQAVGDTLGPAVQLGGVDQVKDKEISFGKGGFQAKAAGAENDGSLISQISKSSTSTPRADGSFLGSLGKSVVAAVGKLGGMALNTGIAIVKKAMTIDNIAQVVLAGVRNPYMGLTVAAGKLADAATQVLTPEYVSAKGKEVMNEVEVMGLSGRGLSEVAVQAAGHGAAHNSYGSRPMTQDGRTAIDATVDWVVAASRDSAGDAATPLAVTQVFPESNFNTDVATQAIEEMKKWKESV